MICRHLLIGFNVTHENYTLFFLGVPDAVSNISVNFNVSCLLNGTIEIEWDPVSSSRTSRGPEENINYSVKVDDLQARIVNTTTSDNFLVAVLPNYTPYNISCLSFNITLSSSNSAGRGNTSSTTVSVLQRGTYANLNTVELGANWLHSFLFVKFISLMCEQSYSGIIITPSQ